MRDPNRIRPTLELIEQIWQQHPDLRLGQLLVNAIQPAEPVPEIFHAEDDRLVEGLRRFADSAKRAADDPLG